MISLLFKNIYLKLYIMSEISPNICAFFQHNTSIVYLLDTIVVYGCVASSRFCWFPDVMLDILHWLR